MQNHIGCISLTFLHCAFSNESLNDLPEKRHSHIGCICLIQWHCQLFTLGFLHLQSLSQSHNYPFVSLALCVVLCPNGFPKLSSMCNWNVKCSHFHFLSALFLILLFILHFTIICRETCALKNGWIPYNYIWRWQKQWSNNFIFR